MLTTTFRIEKMTIHGITKTTITPGASHTIVQIKTVRLRTTPHFPTNNTVSFTLSTIVSPEPTISAPTATLIKSPILQAQQIQPVQLGRQNISAIG